MKNTMKIFALMLGLVSMVMFSSCKKDNEDLIVGKWNVTNMVQAGETINPATYGITMQFEFTKDGKFTEDMTMNFAGMQESDHTEGTYTIDGDALNLTVDGETQSTTIKSLTKDEFVLFMTETDEDGTIEVTITMARI